MDTIPMTKQTEQILIDGYEHFYRLAYSYVQNREDALDVVQESACKAIRDCAQVKNTAFLSTWICRTVVNTAMPVFHRSTMKVPMFSIFLIHFKSLKYLKKLDFTEKFNVLTGHFLLKIL